MSEKQGADRLTLSPTSSYSNSLPSVEDTSILDDRVVNFGLEHLEKAIFADLLSCLWSLYQRSGVLAQRARCRWHLGCGRVSKCQAQVNDQRRLRDQQDQSHASCRSTSSQYCRQNILKSGGKLGKKYATWHSRSTGASTRRLTRFTWLMDQQLIISTVQRSSNPHALLSTFGLLRLLPGSSVLAPKADTLIGS